MSQFVVLDGHEYLASAELGKRFGYTSDYVSRLAREGLVQGVQIKRQWFVEPASFTHFVEKRNQEKQQRAQALRLQRLVERQRHVVSTADTASVPVAAVPAIGSGWVSRTLPSSALALIVVSLGAIVGMMGWTAAQLGISINDLSHGAVAMLEQGYGCLVPSADSVVSELRSSLSRSRVDTATVLTATVPATSRYARSTPLDATTTTAADHFSDPVKVEYLSDGTKVVVPVFRDGRTGKAYRVVVESASATRS